MSTKTYEVRVRYQGVSTYFIDAHDNEEAAEQARARYRNGESGEGTGSEYEEIVGVEVRPMAKTDAHVPTKGVMHGRMEVTKMEDRQIAFMVVTDKLLDAAYRFSPEGDRDLIRAYCTVLLDLDWRGERAGEIRDTLRRVAAYAARDAIEETRIGVRHVGNMVNGRSWDDGDGRAG